jgi:sigma-B regulation protein RsbU (phosphoserine phosphatase)
MKRKRLVDVLLFAPAIALPALALLGVKLPGAILPAVGFTYLLGGYFLLAVRYTQAQDLLSRRQIRLVLLGASPILLVTMVILVIAILNLTLSHLALLYLLNASCLAILAAPVTFAYAFGRYRLLDVEGRLRRGTRFAMINALLLLIFTGILYAFGTLLLKYLAIESRTPTLALGFVLALSFVPAQRGLRGLLERRFYPERLRLRALLQEFLESSGRTLDPSRFWQELTGRLSFGLRAEPVHAYLRTRQGIFTEAEGIAGGCAEPPSSIWDKLHGLESPVLLDELVASERISLTDEERRWTENSCVAVLAPLRGSSQQIGFLLLGRKAEGEDYTHHELELLRSLASQIGLSAENLLLLGDKLERQRLEEQLGVARRIQEGLLPATLHVPGCEVAARIRFCLQVAGDFYDCISLRDGRVLLAIGDVAGKGVGAALLMANVQASLRAIKNTGISLTDVASEINAIVHQNTPSNLFITLFVAIYDPLRRNLTYVNAGHNPPILRRANGEVRHLSTGGLLLGVRAIAEYQHETVSLQPGDMVLMYTDGVVEARDARGDQFGTERLEAMLPLFAPLPLREALDCLEEEVRRFTGRLDMEDDFTLLVLRVNGDGAPIELHQEAAAEVLL